VLSIKKIDGFGVVMFRPFRLSFFAIFVLVSTSRVDNLLSGPESGAWDSLGNRNLVSDYFSGSIVEVDSQGIQSDSYTGLYECASNCIAGDTRYVTSTAMVKLIVGPRDQ